MGYGLEYFVDEVDKEFICKICNKILENPLTVAQCEHYFCRRCIEGHSQCPVDGNECNSATLGPAPKVLKRLLSNLKMRCINTSHGCGIVLPLENMEAHWKACASKPSREVMCVLLTK